LQFEFSADPKFPLLRVDRNVFTSVFYSLIHNAMKYADPHSYVKLEASFERGSGRPALKVKSYGEPISPDERDMIFTKYRRGKVIEQTGRHHSGVGLGLWVAKELLAAVGGEISVELSPSDPRLSVFVVYLPSAVESVAVAIA
jgi:K+-sensing histidine kinase KdpD